MLEVAHAQRNGAMIALALDWEKAFDSLDPAAMTSALRRFGLPQHVLDVMISVVQWHCDVLLRLLAQYATLASGW